jgi:hypothetical protein
MKKMVLFAKTANPGLQNCMKSRLLQPPRCRSDFPDFGHNAKGARDLFIKTFYVRAKIAQYSI